MRAVVLEVDERMLEKRRRLGVDRWDEMWHGVLHMVPPPSERHQHVGTELLLALHPAAAAAGLRLTYETGLFARSDDYRQPDLMAYPVAAAAREGVVGAPALVIEIRSPGDESDEKVAWYLARGATEVLIVDPDELTAVLHRASGRVTASITLHTLGTVVTDADGRLTIIDV